MAREATAVVPVSTDIVLVGGGHSHVAVLKRFGMRPVPGVRLTLVSRDLLTPYSGMLPGLVAGHYTSEEAHIDLRRLCRFAGARFLHASATGLDLAGRTVSVAGRPPVGYDLLSLDIGSRPDMGGIAGSTEHALGVKPVDAFRERWAAAERECLARGGRLRVAVVGGGAGGTELSLSLRHRLRSLLRDAGVRDETEITLIAETREVVESHARPVRRRMTRLLAARGVRLLAGCRAVAIAPGAVEWEAADGRRDAVDCDLAIVATHARAAPWLRASGLDLDERGFIRVRPTLQVLGAPEVFAAGDVASFEGRELPKSGVYAVRQGPRLSDNLARLAVGQPLRTYRPQARTLALISSGDRNAVASWGPAALEGRWVWRLKDRIDRRWMRKYQDLPAMDGAAARPAPNGRRHGTGPGRPRPRMDESADAGPPKPVELIEAASMRCGGCGSKVASAVLRRVLDRLEPGTHPDVLVGFRGGDDAAVLRVPDGKLLVQSVDHFRTFVDDPYLFGRIATA